MGVSATDGAPVQPVAAEPAIDIEHLSRMTLGDRRLEREVLQLFDRQSAMLVERMRSAPGGAVSCAHTLKGSARNLGAWRVAGAAERLEWAGSDAAAYRTLLAQLIDAVEDVRRAIALRLDAAL
jgi:HPt (histidine-containing phosphotransfer) domain-containing protein